MGIHSPIHPASGLRSGLQFRGSQLRSRGAQGPGGAETQQASPGLAYLQSLLVRVPLYYMLYIFRYHILYTIYSILSI